MHYLNNAQDWGRGKEMFMGVFGDGMQGSCTNEENLIM